MDSTFEKLITDVQIDMVEICLEYVNEQADCVYIYCSFEDNALTNNFFFRIKNKLFKKHKLNDLNGNIQFNTSIEYQRAAIKSINQDIEEINNLCKQYNKPMPTEMKIIYDVKKKDFSVDYRYDKIYTNTSDKSAMMICDEWFDSLESCLK